MLYTVCIFFSTSEFLDDAIVIKSAKLECTKHEGVWWRKRGRIQGWTKRGRDRGGGGKVVGGVKKLGIGGGGGGSGSRGKWLSLDLP